MTLPEWVGWLFVALLAIGTAGVTLQWLAPMLRVEKSACETCGGFGYTETAGAEGECDACIEQYADPGFARGLVLWGYYNGEPMYAPDYGPNAERSNDGDS